MECGALNANLTLAPGDRMVITDDLLNGRIRDLAAVSMAAIVARDAQVGRAAILPLSTAASKLGSAERRKYERLFQLIEETAFDPVVRVSAQTLLAGQFRERQIQEIAAELGDTIGPARQRYRAFLDVVKLLSERRISEALFLDEFADFTRQVAGKLDFGIYAMCIDRMFISESVPIMVKISLLREICQYPPLIRKELLTNLLSSDQAAPEFVNFARREVGHTMSREQLTEIVLFTTLKRAWAAGRRVAEQPRT